MLTERCVAHYFLATCTWSSRLVPAHSLCSILLIVHFRKVAPDCPIKNAISDCSRSPSSRRPSKRDADSDEQPPSKRQKPSSSGLVPNSIPRTRQRVGDYTEHDTFDSTLPFEPCTAVETELDILYDRAEEQAAIMQDLEKDADKILTEECATAFALLDQFESEKDADDDAETETIGGPSMVWDHNQDLVQLQASETVQNPSSTPTKKVVQFDLSAATIINPSQSVEMPSLENSNSCHQNDSPPSSVPTPVDSDEHTRSASFAHSEEESDGFEGTSQVTVSVDVPTVLNRPTSTPDEREISPNDRSDNAVNCIICDGKYFNNIINIINYYHCRRDFSKTIWS